MLKVFREPAALSTAVVGVGAICNAVAFGSRPLGLISLGLVAICAVRLAVLAQRARTASRLRSPSDMG